MSVILDALKKLDREKSIRQNVTANIAVEILKPDLPPPGRKFLRYFGIILLTAMAAATMTYVIMVDFLPKSSPPAPVSSLSPSQGTPPAPMESPLPSKALVSKPVSPPAPGQQVTSAPVSREALQDVQREINRKIPEPPIPSESKITADHKPTAASMDEKKAKSSIVREEPEVALSPLKKTPELPTSGSSANPPSLKLSAIVWFEDPAMRFAMVNGIKASEGTVVEGVKVVEINPTSVRFLFNDQYFEISMQK
ncbi:MAG: general secretion pathway protein GspB [Syntrophaceae bacterium]|nr:general secretion pathway protein GspB [Syntrophaceae bacterium]